MAHPYTKALPRLITTFCDAPRSESLFLSNEFWEAVYLDPDDFMDNVWDPVYLDSDDFLDNMSIHCCNEDTPYYDVDFIAFDEIYDLEGEETELFGDSPNAGRNVQIQSAGASPIIPAIFVSQDSSRSASGTESPRSVASSLVSHGGIELESQNPWALSPKEPCKPATSTPLLEQHPNVDRSPSHVSLASSFIKALMRLCRAPTNPSTPDSIVPDQGSAVSEFPLNASWTREDVVPEDQTISCSSTPGIVPSNPTGTRYIAGFGTEGRASGPMRCGQ